MPTLREPTPVPFMGAEEICSEEKNINLKITSKIGPKARVATCLSS
jgi:hypothetical protein